MAHQQGGDQFVSLSLMNRKVLGAGHEEIRLGGPTSHQSWGDWMGRHGRQPRGPAVLLPDPAPGDGEGTVSALTLDTTDCWVLKESRLWNLWASQRPEMTGSQSQTSQTSLCVSEELRMKWGPWGQLDQPWAEGRRRQGEMEHWVVPMWARTLGRLYVAL